MDTVFEDCFRFLSHARPLLAGLRRQLVDELLRFGDGLLGLGQGLGQLLVLSGGGLQLDLRILQRNFLGGGLFLGGD